MRDKIIVLAIRNNKIPAPHINPTVRLGVLKERKFRRVRYVLNRDWIRISNYSDSFFRSISICMTRETVDFSKSTNSPVFRLLNSLKMSSPRSCFEHRIIEIDMICVHVLKEKIFIFYLPLPLDIIIEAWLVKKQWMKCIHSIHTVDVYLYRLSLLRRLFLPQIHQSHSYHLWQACAFNAHCTYYHCVYCRIKICKILAKH
jgi:hypothetical protein